MSQTIEQAPRLASAATGLTRRARVRRRRRQRLHRMIPVALMLLGALVLTYPVGATFYNNAKQSEFARDYLHQVQSAEPTTVRDELAKARAYNASLKPGLLRDPWTEGKSELSADYRDYLTQLDLFDAMARLRIPAIGVDLPVLHGTTDATLARGVGHFFGSALPAGGPGTHAVLTAHSSLASATLFDHLPQLSVGDEFTIDVYGQTLTYRVDRTDVVLPDQIDALGSVPGADYVTLVTCTPYAVNSHRLLVRGVRVPFDQTQRAPTGAAPATTNPFVIQSWMLPRIVGAAAALLLAIVMVVTDVVGERRRRARLAGRRPVRRTTDGSPS